MRCARRSSAIRMGKSRYAIRLRSCSSGGSLPISGSWSGTGKGHSVSQGRVPREYAEIGAALDGIGQARLGWNIGDGARPTARLKWIDAPAGNLQIMTGSGGTVSWRRVALATSTFSQRRSSGRRLDDAGDAYRHSHRGSANARRACPRRVAISESPAGGACVKMTFKPVLRAS